MKLKGGDTDFVVHDRGRTDDKFAASRRALTTAFQEAFRAEQAHTQNDPNRLRGFIQGRNQCLSACIVAYGVLQDAVGSDRQEMLQTLQRVDAVMGNDGSGLIHFESAKAIPLLTATDDEAKSIQEGMLFTSISDRPTVGAQGARTAEILMTGGVGVLKGGDHFTLVFCDKMGTIQHYDPLHGTVTAISPSEVFEHVFSHQGDSEAYMVFIPPRDDFVVL